MSDRIARAFVSTVLRRLRAGRIEVRRGRPASRARSDRAGAELRATVTIHDPAAWRSLLRGSVGLGEAYVDGLWETDDLVALMRIAARELRQLDGLRGADREAARPAPPAAPPGPREHPRGGPAPHLRPLRPRQRPLRLLPRRADGLLLRLLPRGGSEPRGGAAGQARADLRAAAARPREPPAGDRQRLGRACDPRRPPRRLPGDDDDDLPRAARAGRAAGRARPASRIGSRSCFEDYRDLDGRYDRLVSVEMIEAVGWQHFDEFFRALRRAAHPRRPDAAAGDHDRRPPLRGREGGAQLRQHPRLPRRLPALGGPDRRLRRPRHRDAPGLVGGHHRALPAHPRRLARALPRRLGAAPRRAATTSASAASGPST